MNNETKQTAVEWLEIELEKLWVEKYLSPITIKPLLEQAKQMEHENLLYRQAKSYNIGFFDGKNNETYGGNKWKQ